MMPPTEEKLTDEQAEAMLKMLAKHFHQPVLPLDRYCAALNSWGRVIGQRANTLRERLFPNLYDYGEKDETGQRQRTATAKEQQAESDRVEGIEKVRGFLTSGLTLFPPEVARTARSTEKGDSTPTT